MNVLIEIQGFDGIEDMGFEPYGSKRINATTWEIDSLFLYNAYRNAQDKMRYAREFEKVKLKTLVDRFCSACSQAMKESDGWRTATYEDKNDIRTTTGKTLGDAGLIATRYNTVPKEGGSFRHTSIGLRFSDGEEIIVPTEVDILWNSVTFVVNHLNAINFQGVTWVDKSSSHVWEQFFG